MTVSVKVPIDELIEELYNIPENGKAEIINGEVIPMSPTGALPSRTGGFIYAQLLAYEERTGAGYAFPDNAGFLVDLPNRNSFSPDAAFFVGELTGGKFLDGAPIFAVEVRSEGDYGPAAERAIQKKIADYFAAGTLVAWDVDVLRDKEIRVYRAANPDNPTIYGRGDLAEAEPALPGWTVKVNQIFR